MTKPRTMRLTIVAATGGIGQHLLRQALTAGHDITVVVRTPAKVDAPVRVIAADLSAPGPGVLAEAVDGSDAILSGLGARTKADTGVASRGTAALIDAARKTGVDRLVVVSAAPIGTFASPARPRPPRHDPGDGFFMRHLGVPFTHRAFREHYADLARMEDAIRASDLSWTISRPPKLTGKPLTARYRTAVDRNVRGGFSIGRADVAHQMLACLGDPATIGHTIGLAT